MHSTIPKFARNLVYCNLGRMKYGEALAVQEMLVKRQLQSDNRSTSNQSISQSPPQHSDSHFYRSSNCDTLLIVEHDPVYTVGIRSNEFTEVDVEELRNRGADFHRTNRGGLITFHGPGQLVAYPILNLQHYKPSVRWYVSQLEEVLIKTCHAFGVKCGRTENTGIWVKQQKIAAIGLNCKKYITSHGVALNCNTDLRWFDSIVPCGLKNLGVTSLTRERNIPTDIANVLPVFLSTFADVFAVDDLTETSFNELKSERSLIEKVKNRPL